MITLHNKYNVRPNIRKTVLFSKGIKKRMMDFFFDFMDPQCLVAYLSFDNVNMTQHLKLETSESFQPPKKLDL